MKPGNILKVRICGAVAILLLSACSATATAAPKLFKKLPNNAMGDANERPEVVAIKARADTKSVALFRLNVDALKGKEAEIALADAPPVVASRDSYDVDPKDSKKFVWTGTLAALPGAAAFAVNDGKMQGTIRNGLDLYRVETVQDGIHAVIKIDQTKFPKQDEPPSQADRPHNKKAADAAHDGPPQSNAQSPVIDVLVAYTSSASTAVADIDSLIKVAFAETNQSYRNSKMRLEVKLVETMPLANYSEPENFDQILNDFVAMADVKQRMVSSGADIAVLIMNSPRYCGMANAIGATPDTAFAIVHYNCATGYYSFGHEIGHLLGARHDPAHDPEPGDNHGHQHAGPNGWRTVMAYNCEDDLGCIRLPYWSNPNIQYPAGSPVASPMGVVDTSNNARVLGSFARDVAAFRTSGSTNVAQSK